MSGRIYERMDEALEKRRFQNRLRTLATLHLPIDFSSNDYLGITRSAWVSQRVQELSADYPLGSTGSRLLTGQSDSHEDLEQYLAEIYRSEAALLFNSGYDANTGLLSTVIRKGDRVLYDEAVHASIHQGIRLSEAAKAPFRHNDVRHLETLLGENREAVTWVVAESYYSMDGDQAPLQKLADLCHQYEAHLVIDEAHALGCFGQDGRGLCMEGRLPEQVFARVITFGKGMGHHGAAVLCSRQVKEYLVNFCKPFIYTTAIPPHSMAVIRAAHEFVGKFHHLQERLHQNILYFQEMMSGHPSLKGSGPVFAWLVPGEAEVRKMAAKLQEAGMDVRPIVSPTVPVGTERLRISIHAFNTKEEISQLVEMLKYES